MRSSSDPRFVALGWLLLTACGGSKAPGTEEAPANGSFTAGGEASEFGGDSPYCQPASATRLDLARENMAPWVGLVEGHHELSFAWQRQFLTEDITGFQEKTSASLDVTVLEALDVHFDEFCNRGPRSLQFELEVSVATADGALQGKFRHRVGTAPGTSPTLGEPLSTYLVLPYTPPSLDGFTGSLAYGVDLRSQARREIGAELVFEGTTLIGWLSPFLAPVSSGWRAGAGWSPIKGVFPDDGCSRRAGRALDLDAELSGFAEQTPRALYERAISLWQGRPMAAEFGGSDTTLEVSAGEPSQVCQSRSHVQGGAIVIEVPLRLETTDGQVALEQTLGFTFFPGTTTVSATNWPPLWIPVDRFEQVTGIANVDFRSAEFASVDLQASLDLATNTSSGTLYVNEWQDVDSRDSGYPGLVW